MTAVGCEPSGPFGGCQIEIGCSKARASTLGVCSDVPNAVNRVKGRAVPQSRDRRGTIYSAPDAGRSRQYRARKRGARNQETAMPGKERGRQTPAPACLPELPQTELP